VVYRWVVGVAALAVVPELVVAAPQRLVRGVVVDEQTGDAVEGALVTSEHGTVATAADGTFSIALSDGERELIVTAPGYILRTVSAGRDASLHVVLAASHELIEVVGRAPRARQRPRIHADHDPSRPAAQTYGLTPEELRALPGTGNDALRAAQILPGVARLPYSFGGIVLRGAAPRDSAVYLDGVEVPIAFHFGGVTSFYPSGMLADLQVKNGGIDASYGRASGGMIMMRSREPRTDRWRTGGAVGLLDSAVFAEGPWSGGGILVGVRRSYFDIVAAPFASEDTPMPSYWDAQLRSSFGSPTRRGRITPMMFLALDHMSRTEPGRDFYENENSITSFFIRVAVPYDRDWGKTALRVVPWLGTNQLSFRSRINGIVERFSRPVYPGGVRTELTRETAWGDVRTGIDMQGGYLTHMQSGLGHKGDILVQENGETTVQWLDLGVWGETRFAIDRLSVKPGVRVERYGLTGESVLDPRLSMTLQLTERWLLRETAGRYHQPPTPGDVDPNGGNPALRSSYNDSVALGVETQRDDGWTGSLTGYYTWGERLGVRRTNGMTDFSTLGGLGPTFSLLLEKQLGLAFHRDNIGNVRNYGLELLVRRVTPRWSGLFAYTLARAQRYEGPSSIGWRPFELEQRHNVNVAGSFTVGAHWRLGARVQVVSGMPYSPTIGSTIEGDPVFDPYAARLPVFFQLDLRADRLWKRCWGTLDLYFDIQNITNRRNVEGREPNDFNNGDDDIRGLPLMPFIGVEFIPS
jgi:hypothetical protein